MLPGLLLLLHLNAGSAATPDCPHSQGFALLNFHERNEGWGPGVLQREHLHLPKALLLLKLAGRRWAQAGRRPGKWSQLLGGFLCAWYKVLGTPAWWGCDTGTDGVPEELPPAPPGLVPRARSWCPCHRWGREAPRWRGHGRLVLGFTAVVTNLNSQQGSRGTEIRISSPFSPRCSLKARGLTLPNPSRYLISPVSVLHKHIKYHKAKLQGMFI